MLCGDFLVCPFAVLTTHVNTVCLFSVCDPVSLFRSNSYVSIFEKEVPIINLFAFQSPLQVSEHLLSIYLDEYPDTPWDALKYLVSVSPQFSEIIPPPEVGPGSHPTSRLPHEMRGRLDATHRTSVCTSHLLVGSATHLYSSIRLPLHPPYLAISVPPFL